MSLDEEKRATIVRLELEKAMTSEVLPPCVYSEEEAIAELKSRIADLDSGKDYLIPHNEVMREMDEMLFRHAI